MRAQPHWKEAKLMSDTAANRPLLEVKGLKEYFDINMGFLRSCKSSNILMTCA